MLTRMRLHTTWSRGTFPVPLIPSPNTHTIRALLSQRRPSSPLKATKLAHSGALVRSRLCSILSLPGERLCLWALGSRSWHCAWAGMMNNECHCSCPWGHRCCSGGWGKEGAVLNDTNWEIKLRPQKPLTSHTPFSGPLFPSFCASVLLPFRKGPQA